ncbi:MAG TPA: RDD family protein [Bryobacteraceae bacterium]|nr:RDD family protein [Bryobacteraceae bacterium]
MFCNVCGAAYAAGASKCAACGAALTSTTPTSPSGYPLAGLGGRFVAVILDTILGVVFYAMAGTWAAARWGGTTSAGFSLEGTPALVAIIATLLFGFFYYWLCEGIFGTTLGKSILGMAVRRKDGGGCTLASSLVRNLLRVIDGFAVYVVGFLVAIFSKSRQRLGDHVARTVVVLPGIGIPARLALALVWVVLCGGGLMASYLLHQSALSQ